jgi:type II secretory pathway pseudopilin PulG
VKSKKINQKGFTLFEGLLTLSILIAIGLVGLYVSSHHSNARLNTQTESTSASVKVASINTNCTSESSNNYPEAYLNLTTPSCWKINYYVGGGLSIDSSNKYVTSCPLPNPYPNQTCYASRAYVYIDTEPLNFNSYQSAQKWSSSGYSPTTFNSQQAYCVNPSLLRAGTLPADIPANIPPGIFSGAGCYITGKEIGYDIYIQLDANKTDAKQVYNILESIGFN